MNIRIIYKNEEFHFNLFEELTISEDRINSEIKDQPSAYAFLAMLQKKLWRKEKDLEKEMEKKFSELFTRYKQETNEATGRVYDKEYAYHIANKHPAYQKKIQAWLDAKDDTDTLLTCVEAFFQRANLIQSLSANIRKSN